MRKARLVSLTFAAALVLSGAACGGGSGESGSGYAKDTAATPSSGTQSQALGASAVPEKVKKAAAIAKAIQADPDAAEAILGREKITREEFEDLLYEIAADPGMSAAYARELGG